jgi:hypothetical protein
MSKLIGKRKREYLSEVVRQDLDLDASSADRLTGRLDEAIRSLRTTKEQRKTIRSAPGPAVAAAPPFDPYAFNAILMLKRQGRDALAAQLAGIGEISHLRQLAEAQLIGLDQTMRSGPIAIEDLREAVLRGVERLVADRRAAAS